MEIFKIILLTAVMGMCTVLGIMKANKFKLRVIDLQEIKKALNLAITKIRYTYEPLPELFKEICDLLELSEDEYTNKIGDFFQMLSTDHRFIMLEKGFWDLKNRHQTKVIIESDDETDTEEVEPESTQTETEDDTDITEPDYDSDNFDSYDDTVEEDEESDDTDDDM